MFLSRGHDRTPCSRLLLACVGTSLTDHHRVLHLAEQLSDGSRRVRYKYSVTLPLGADFLQGIEILGYKDQHHYVFITSLAEVPSTAAANDSTDSFSPSIIALRWLAMPWPCRALLSASASACFTLRIFSASPRALAATCSRCAALISFIADFTFSSGWMSVTSA